jgi:hypothetical protein
MGRHKKKVVQESESSFDGSEIEDPMDFVIMDNKRYSGPPLLRLTV